MSLKWLGCADEPPASSTDMSVVDDLMQQLLAAKELQTLSDATAAAGETEGAGTDDAQGQHFIAFVNFQGMLYELDGRNFDHDAEGGEAQPVCHGANRVIPNESEPVEVLSLFGGLAIYRFALLDGCWYDEAARQCEHVALNRCLRRRKRRQSW